MIEELRRHFELVLLFHQLFGELVNEPHAFVKGGERSGEERKHQQKAHDSSLTLADAR